MRSLHAEGERSDGITGLTSPALSILPPSFLFVWSVSTNSAAFLQTPLQNDFCCKGFALLVGLRWMSDRVMGTMFRVKGGILTTV